MENKELMIKLFNAGKLTLDTAVWCAKDGYYLEIETGGKVLDIKREEDYELL